MWNVILLKCGKYAWICLSFQKTSLNNRYKCGGIKTLNIVQNYKKNVDNFCTG
jgi:hypothetical protein